MRCHSGYTCLVSSWLFMKQNVTVLIKQVSAETCALLQSDQGW